MSTRKFRNLEVSKELSDRFAPDFAAASRTSVIKDKDVGEFYYTPIEKLIPFSSQARIHYDDTELQNLAASIQEHGITQPLTVIASKKEPGKYEVVSGERRLRASKSIGLEKIPCIIIQDYKKAEEIAIVENIHRENLHPIELGQAYKKLLDNKIVQNQIELAKKLSVSKSNVTEHLSYCDLPEWVQSHLIEHNIKARAIIRQCIKNKDDNGKLEKILMQKENRNIDSFSIVRISCKAGAIQLHEDGLKKLNLQQRKALKKQIENLLSRL